VMMPFEWR